MEQMPKGALEMLYEAIWIPFTELCDYIMKMCISDIEFIRKKKR